MDWSYTAYRSLSGELRALFRRDAAGGSIEKFNRDSGTWADGSWMLVRLASGEIGDADLISEGEANALIRTMVAEGRPWWKFWG
jgi:hypothetical protein